MPSQIMHDCGTSRWTTFGAVALLISVHYTFVAGYLDECSKMPSYIILAGLKLLAQVSCSCKFTLATGVDRALGRVSFMQV